VGGKLNCFYWLEKGKLAGSCVPKNEEDVKYIVNQGIKRVIILLEDKELSFIWKSPDEYFKKLSSFNMVYLHEPVEDFMPPSTSQLLRILKWIKSDDSAVLVHCAGGYGRTGTVLASWLIIERGYKFDEAINKVRSLRPGSIESQYQLKFLKDLSKKFNIF